MKQYGCGVFLPQIPDQTLKKSIIGQTIDPDPTKHVIPERKFVKPGDFSKFVTIEDYGHMLEKAVEWYEKNI